MGVQDVANKWFGYIRKRRSITNVAWAIVAIFAAFMVVREAFGFTAACNDVMESLMEISPAYETHHYGMNSILLITNRVDGLINYSSMVVLDFFSFKTWWYNGLFVLIVFPSAYFLIIKFSADSANQV
jgi:hypothetical protein